MQKKKVSGSEAGKQMANAVVGRDTTLSSNPSGNNAPNGERASTVNASASSTHLPSKKDQEKEAKVVVKKTSKVIKLMDTHTYLHPNSRCHS